MLDNKPSATFWTVLAQSLEKQCKDAARGKSQVLGLTPDIPLSLVAVLGSTFMVQTLSSGYPRLLRLFHEFFAKIGVHTDTAYTQDKQRFESGYEASTHV